MLNSQQEDKLIKKSAVVAGLVFVSAVTIISAFSQWHPNAILNKSYTRRSITQSPSGTTTTPRRALTISGSLPRSGSATATDKFSTTPDSKTTSSRFTPPSNITAPSKLPLPIAKPTGSDSIAANSSSSQTKYVGRVIDAGRAKASGLVVAREGRIKPYTKWRKAQEAVFLVRHGKTRQAIRRARTPRAVLRQVREWSQNRL